jgi:hypothetical protein
MCYERELIDGDPPIRELMNEFSIENDPSGELCDTYIKSEIRKYKAKLEIPEGVHLMACCGMIMSDIPQFMKFAKWWLKGEMTDEMFDLFCFHYCEIVEVDYFWVLMDEPGNYYGAGLEELAGSRDSSESNEGSSDLDTRGYVKLEQELRRIGTRSKKKAKLSFQMKIGHN